MISTSIQKRAREALGVWPLLCAWIGLLACPVKAQKASETYYVMQIDPKGLGGVVVSIGRDSGAEIGDEIRIHRVVKVRHPVTKKMIRDRVPIGQLVLKRVGDKLSVAVADKQLQARVRVGDEVELLGEDEAAPKPAPSPGARSAEAAQPAMDPATAAALAAWKRSLGKSPEQRIAIWEAFNREHPKSPYSLHVAIEIKSMRDLLAKLAEPAPAAAPGRPPREAAPALSFDHQPKQALYTGEPMQVAIRVDEREQVRSADVYFRRRDAATYQKLPMERDGDAYLRAEVPSDQVAPPGVDYFVEVVDAEGQVHPAVGSQRAPQGVEVGEPPGSVKVDHTDRSQISVLGDYVNFKLDEGDDFYWMLETDFLYRVLGMLYSIRVGFGALRGKGASVEALKESLPSNQVGFNYGYTELELRFHESFSIMGRALLGLNRPPGQETGVMAGGFEGKLRIGRELGTNLVMGGAIIEDIGALGLLELSWDVVDYFPMSGRVEVTSQPVGEDIGVRIMYQIGVRALDWFQPTLRVGVALRRIDHFGLSVGLGTVFCW